jgi:hypothetical protein
MQNMERALAKGHRIIAARSDNDDLKVIAARGPKVGQFSLVLINPAGAGEVKLSGLPKNATCYGFVNSPIVGTTGVLPRKTTDAQGQVAFTLPARSVLTVLNGSFVN